MKIHQVHRKSLFALLPVLRLIKAAFVALDNFYVEAVWLVGILGENVSGLNHENEVHLS